MTAEEFNSRITNGLPTILIDVRDVSEYMKFNIGGNRMTLAELERNAHKFEEIKKTHVAVVGCVYFDSKRVPSAMKRLFDIGFNEVFSLDGSKHSGGGLLTFSNMYPRVRVPQVKLF